MTIKVLLVDDHKLLLQALKFYLEAVEGLEVVGEATDGAQALMLADRLKPAVLIVDITIPSLNGIELIRQVTELLPNAHSVVLSMAGSDDTVIAALSAGASAYVLKESPMAELVEGIRVAHEGGKFMCSALCERAARIYNDQARAWQFDPYEALTKRQRQVLQLLAEGYTTGQIAAKLVVGNRTAETHRANVMRKLGLCSRRDVIRYAAGKGLLSTVGPVGR